jgi:prevent-host-death family protein
MTVMTFRSEEARSKFRDVMEAVIAGKEVVIERYSRPTAVVVNYDQWRAIPPHA